ncbi:MAG: hypothetical protein QOF57_2760, partial [Frankiaceae bacterium]|nr:hypothetical protein [Frankiaceae bacterium]
MTIDATAPADLGASSDTVVPQTGRAPHTHAGFRPDVEGLRAVAILPVVAYHAAQFAAPSAGHWISRTLGQVTGGFLGVDVFFVISGFLITGLLAREVQERGTISFGRFYARRARRILPAATVVLLVTLAASALILPAARAGQVAHDVLSAAVFQADMHFAGAGVDYMGVAVDPSPVLHFWSLNDEEKFYVVWPAVLMVAALLSLRRRNRPATARRRHLAFALLALTLPSLWWSQHLVSAHDPTGYYLAPSRAFELGIGGLLALGMPLVERLGRAARVLGAVAGLAVVVVCMFTYTALTPFPGVAALPVALGTALVLAGHPRGITARVLSARPVRWVGRVSYSLYLWHWPVLVLAAAAAGGRLRTLPLVACVGFAFVLAELSYRFCERPAQRWHRLRPAPRALLFGAALVALAVGASSGVGQLADARIAAADSAAGAGIVPITKADRGLLYVGDSLTSRGRAPLETALRAANWDYRIDALGGRPIVGGSRATWTPTCAAKPLCGGDLVLSSRTPPATVVIALGSNSMSVQRDQVRPPTATDAGTQIRLDPAGRYRVTGLDSPADVTREVDRIMALVPKTTTVYWVGVWLDDKLWGEVPWRAQNAAMRQAVQRYGNAHF